MFSLGVLVIKITCIFLLNIWNMIYEKHVICAFNYIVVKWVPTYISYFYVNMFNDYQWNLVPTANGI